LAPFRRHGLKAKETLMLTAVPGKPFFFRAPTGADVTVVSLSMKAGPNEPVFRYAGQALTNAPTDAGEGMTLPGVTFTVLAGKRRLSALAPFATTPRKGEFFFQEVVEDGTNVSVVNLGSVVPDDDTIAWTIEGV
jgi:hypothetical protein